MTHNGHIEVTQTSERGTCVRIRLPIGASTQRTEIQRTRAGARMTDSRTVLLVDDDPSFRRVVEYQLQEDGYRVLSAPSAAAALQRFQAERVDLVLTDVRMPESDGMELLARLKLLQPDLPVVDVDSARDDWIGG